MNTEDLVIDHSSDSKVVEDLSEGAPHIKRPIFADAFIVETVDFRNEARLVVSPQQSDPVFVAHLQGQQHQESFNAVTSSVDVVPKEDIVSIGRIASDLE